MSDPADLSAPAELAVDDPVFRAGTAGRAALTVTVLTAVSRATGLVRVLVVTAVLRDTFLGDTYQSANTVPNVLFELVAAGALAAVLLPSLVEALDAGGRPAAERLAGHVLGVVLIAMGGVAVVMVVTAPITSAVITAGIDAPEIRSDARSLCAFFLVLFAPQLVCYGVGAVATGSLHALQRFAAPAIAPAVNNVVVVAAYVVFDRMHSGGDLDLSAAELAVLGAGTTVGVIAFCSVPVIALARSGFSMRPRTMQFDNEAGRALRQRGAWAVAYVAASQIMIAAVVLLANGPGGQVVAYQFAFTLFALPFALVAVPIATALYPRLARAAGERRAPQRLHAQGEPVPLSAQSLGPVGFTATWERGLRATVVLLAPAAVALVVLAIPVVRFSLGDSVRHPEAVAHALAALGPGLLGYSAFFLLTRAWYADGDARTPALVNGGVALAGVVTMVIGAAMVDGDDRAAALAAAHSLAYTAGAVALVIGLRRRGRPSTARRSSVETTRNRRTNVGVVLGAVAAGVAMAVLATLIPGAGRLGGAADLVVAGAIGLVVYAIVVRLVAGPLRPLVALGP